MPILVQKETQAHRPSRPSRGAGERSECETAILDGDLVVLNHLLSLNGMDLRKLPLLARKDKLKRILSSRSPHILYVDHSRGNGTALYRLACQLDLEIVAKRADSRYEDSPNVRHWIKIKNPAYSQREGRGDQFKRTG